MDLCLEAERRPGDRVAKRWRGQKILRFTGVQGEKEADTEGLDKLEGMEE